MTTSIEIYAPNDRSVKICDYQKIKEQLTISEVEIGGELFIRCESADKNFDGVYKKAYSPLLTLENLKYAIIEPSIFDFYHSQKYMGILIFCKYTKSGELP